LGDICEQIIPADDFPGARELGVATFIERVLREAHPEWTTVYQAGLNSTEASSQKVFRESFAKLTSDQQFQLLQRMERGDLPSELWPSPSTEDFFSMVRSHTMQGFYSNPRWGGNRDKLAWKMIGFDDWWV
jgi:gluconate 2-dehydrogenase gamma chain